MTRRSRNLCRLVLGAALVFAAGAAAEESGRFDLLVGVEDARGRPAAELAPGDLEVGEGRAAVVDVRPLAGAEGLAARLRGRLDAPSATPWRLAIYFDPALTTRRSRFRAADALARRAAQLTALGSVEIVVAGREPEVRLGRTRDPKIVRAALRQLARRAGDDEDLAAHRTEFAMSWVREQPTDDAAAARVATAVEREGALLAERFAALHHWLFDHPALDGPAALFWICDGFDEDVADFYLRGIAEPAAREALRADLPDYRVGLEIEALSRSLAATGWIPVPVSMRAWPTAAGVDLRKLLADPVEPLAALAARTGGALVREAGATSEALADLGGRWRVSCEWRGDAGGERQVAVASRRPKLAVRTVFSLSPGEADVREAASRAAEALQAVDVRAIPGLEDAPPVYLVPPEAMTVTGRVLLEAQATRPDVASVAFWIDGEKVATVRKPPFEARVSFPSVPAPRTVRATAYDAGDEELGADSMVVNRDVGRLEVSFREPREIRGPGRYGVELDVFVPQRRFARQVALFRDGELLRTWEHPPYRHELEIEEEAPSGFLRAEAVLDDGSTAEDVLPIGREGFTSQVDVDLVELYTVVRDRHGKLVPGLSREDFEIREDGLAQEIERFEHPVETPLSLGLVIDVSGSLVDHEALLLRSAREFVDRVLGEDDRGFVVAFDARPLLLQPLTGDRELLSSALARLGLYFGMSTAVYDAVIFSIMNLRGLAGRKALVVLTDGDDNVSRHTFHQCLELARRSRFPIYVIGLGSINSTARFDVRRNMRRLARSTGAEVHLIDSAEELPAAYAAVAAELGSQYLLAYESNQPKDKSGWREIRLDVRDSELSARTIGGYYVPVPRDLP